MRRMFLLLAVTAATLVVASGVALAVPGLQTAKAVGIALAVNAPAHQQAHRRQVGGVPRRAVLRGVPHPPGEDLRTGTPRRRRQRRAPKPLLLGLLL